MKKTGYKWNTYMFITLLLFQNLKKTHRCIELDEYSRILGNIRQNIFTCLNH